MKYEKEKDISESTNSECSSSSSDDEISSQSTLLDIKECTLSLVTESSSDTVQIPAYSLDENDDNSDTESESEESENCDNLNRRKQETFKQNTKNASNPKMKKDLQGAQVSITHFFPKTAASKINVV